MPPLPKVYEKPDFDALYAGALNLPGGRNLSGYRHPSLESLVDYNPVTGVTVDVHYHPAQMKPWAVTKAQDLADFFAAQDVPLLSTDCIVLIGEPWNWVGEALEDLNPGLEALSVDLSQYVEDTKGLSADDELIEAITAAGYSHTLPNSVGEWVYSQVSDASPRCRNTAKMVQTDLRTNKARNDVRRVFQRNTVTRCVTVEVWQTLTQEEQDNYTAAALAYGATLTHIIDGEIVAG